MDFTSGLRIILGFIFLGVALYLYRRGRKD